MPGATFEKSPVGAHPLSRSWLTGIGQPISMFLLPLGTPALARNQEKVNQLPNQQQTACEHPNQSSHPTTAVKTMDTSKTNKHQTPKQVGKARIGMFRFIHIFFSRDV
jgi:hypothetical protein